MGEMKDKLKDKLNNQLADVDKQKLKDNAKQGWSKFVTFVEDFTDKIFISVLIGVGIWNILRLFVFGDAENVEIIATHKVVNTIVVLYMFMFAGLIFILMREDDPRRVLLVHYAAFLEDDYGRVFFLLFTAMFTYPMDGNCQIDKGCTNNDWANWMAGTFLSTAAVINIIKVFKAKKASKRGTMDPHAPQMEDQPTGERKENFIDRDFHRHSEGEDIRASSQDFLNNPDTPILNPTYDSSLLDDEDEEHGYKEEPVSHVVAPNQEQP